MGTTEGYDIARRPVAWAQPGGPRGPCSPNVWNI